jgi:ferredoxin-NADP reductase
MTPVSLGTEQERRVRVTQLRWEADGVLSLRLEDPDGLDLLPWEPGAHVDLRLPSGLVRQYSLCGHPDETGAYTVAVLREAAGRGGSAEIHDVALAGRELTIRGPRNRFPLVDAPEYLFVAGGIGITPILSMIREVAARDVPWTLHYGGRSLKSMAFREVLSEIGGDRVHFVPEDEAGRLRLDEILPGVRETTVIYTCGPAGLIAAIQERAGATGALHVERFSAPADDAAMPPVDTDVFEVELASNGQVLEVPPGRSILDAVRDVRPEVMSSCEEGFCGTCETKVLAGIPEHRDTILTAAERERGASMMICVGRSRSPRLVLDL